jgi:CheY-like chemotaxis protein
MTYILMIEDNMDNAELVRRALASLDMEIRHFTRGLEGSREATTHRPAIILLDFNLPDVDGRNLILTLKRMLGGTKAPPIVAVTARANYIEQSLAQRFGVDAFVAKPFEPLELLQTVRQLLPAQSNP